MDKASVVDFMYALVEPLTASITFTSAQLEPAADYMQSVYGVPYADMTQDAKFHALAEFFAYNALLTSAAAYYKFSADNTSIDGNNLFTHLNAMWRNALSMAQMYLAEAGIVITVPGAPLPPRNYGWRLGAYDTNYLENLPTEYS